MKYDIKYAPSPEYRFWVYDCNGDGMSYFKDAHQRDCYAEEVVEHYLDEDGWSEDVTGCCCGEVTAFAQQVDVHKRPPDSETEDDGGVDEEGCDGEGRYWPPDVTEICNYKMLPIDAQDTDTKEGRSNG